MVLLARMEEERWDRGEGRGSGVAYACARKTRPAVFRAVDRSPILFVL